MTREEKLILGLMVHKNARISALGIEGAPARPVDVQVNYGGDWVKLSPNSLAGLRDKALLELKYLPGVGIAVQLSDEGRQRALAVSELELETAVKRQRLIASMRRWAFMLVVTCIVAIMFAVVASRFSDNEIIRSPTSLAVQIAAVLLISFIRVPGDWADLFITSFIGGIPAWARIGLALWLLATLYLLFLGALGSQQSSLRTIAVLVANYPILALTFGPAVALVTLVIGRFRD